MEQLVHRPHDLALLDGDRLRVEERGNDHRENGLCVTLKERHHKLFQRIVVRSGVAIRKQGLKDARHEHRPSGSLESIERGLRCRRVEKSLQNVEPRKSLLRVRTGNSRDHQLRQVVGKRKRRGEVLDFYDRLGELEERQVELPVLRLNHPASATTSSWRKRTFFRTSKNSRPPDVLLARTNKLFLQASQRREIATFILSSNVFVEEATSANFETFTASVSSSLEGTSNGLDTPYLVTKESV